MNMLNKTLVCALLVLSSASVPARAEVQTESIPLDQVSAKALETANTAEQGVEWSKALRRSDTAAVALSYVLQGRIVLRPERYRVQGDGDLEIIPGEYQDVEIEVLVDGTLKYVVKSINLDDVPEVVLMALKKTIDIEPSLAWSARTSLRGEPIAYIISIDANGILRYGITADGKRVEKL